MARQPLSERIGAWLGLDDDWRRPGPRLERRDAAIAAAMAMAAAMNLELLRGYVSAELLRSRPLEYGLIVLEAAPLLWRRRFPLASTLVVFAGFVVTTRTAGEVNSQLVGMALIFLSVFSAVNWAASRRAVTAVIAGILLADLVWLTWDVAVGSGLERISDRQGDGAAHGLLGPALSYGIYSYLVNIVFFVAAFAFGTSAWRRARQQDQLADQAAQIARQAEQLRDRAIVEERLRIARELHDVVAHHVSVTGVQAAAARRALARRPERAAGALSAVEESSREAIGQMRGLLGALRGAGAEPAWVSPRASSREILDRLLGAGVEGRRVVVQCHGAGDDGLSEALREAGAEVTPLTVYRWGPPPDAGAVTDSIDELRAARFDAVAFTSSPGSAAWVRALDRAGALAEVRAQNLAGRLLLAAVGPVAAEPLVGAGLDAGCPERGRMGALVRYISTRVAENALTCVIPAGLLRVHATDAALGQRPLRLSPGGLAVARLLAGHPGETVSREQILRVLPGDSTDPHAAEVAIARLREALASPASIRTVVRRGYRLVDAS